MIDRYMLCCDDDWQVYIVLWRWLTCLYCVVTMLDRSILCCDNDWHVYIVLRRWLTGLCCIVTMIDMSMLCCDDDWQVYIVLWRLTGPSCDEPGWKYYNGFCWYVSESGAGEGDISWYYARYKCFQRGADLASIHTQLDNAVLTNIVSICHGEMPSSVTLWVYVTENAVLSNIVSICHGECRHL